MSFYDTIRCLYHDPRYVWDLHGDDIVGGTAVMVSLFAMFAW
jgi:hypothetical protein